MPDQNERLTAAQQRVRDAWQAERDKFLAFIQTLKDEIAAEPQGVLSEDQVTALEAQADALVSEISNQPVG